MKRIILLIALMIVVPISANAMTEDEMKAKLDIIPFKTVDGQKYLETTIIDPDIMLEDGRCNKTIDISENSYNKYVEEQNKTLEENPEMADILTIMSYDEWKENQELLSIEENKSCTSEFYKNVIKIFLSSLNLKLKWEDTYDIGFNYENPNKTQATFYYFDRGDDYDNQISYDVIINYITPTNKSEFNTATNTLKKFKDSYSVLGMTLFNSIYHNGSVFSLNNTELIISRYPEIKEIMELNPNYKYEMLINGGGGSPYDASFTSPLGIFKDGKLFNIKEISLNEHYVIYVDKDLEGTVFERAEKRLEEYFNNKINISVVDTGWEPYEDYGPINKNLGTQNHPYSVHTAEVTMGDTIITVGIVEIEKNKLDEVIIRSFDYKTGVNVKTSSYDVPVDASIFVKDAKTEEYVKETLKDNDLEIVTAYDITLSKRKDGTLIRTIENGIEVYLPVDDSYKENEEVNVYYIKEDSTIGETLKGKVVKVNDKLYIKFTTNHFSTYAVAKTIQKQVENENTTIPTLPEEEVPKTFDGIGNSVLFGTISLIGLVGATIYLKKKNKVRA